MENNQQHYEKFEITQPKIDPMLGRNKSHRPWKLGLNKKRSNNYTVNPGLKMTWQQKKSRAEEMKNLRQKLKQFKDKKQEKKKDEKIKRKQKKKLKELNAIKSGKFEVIKNNKKIKKWSKKMRAQLVNLPAQMFQNLIANR